MKIEMCDETRTVVIASVGILALTAVLVCLIVCSFKKTKLAFENGYIEVQQYGHESTLWQKK